MKLGAKNIPCYRFNTIIACIINNSDLILTGSSPELKSSIGCLTWKFLDFIVKKQIDLVQIFSGLTWIGVHLEADQKVFKLVVVEDLVRREG